MLRHTALWRVRQSKTSKWARPFSAKVSKGRSHNDSGRATAGAIGDTRLTESKQYRSSQLHEMLRTTKAMEEAKRRVENVVVDSRVGARRADALRDFDSPTTADERVAADRFDAKFIGFANEEGGADDPARGDAAGELSSRERRDRRVRGVDEPVSSLALRRLREHTDNQRKLKVNFPILPSIAKYEVAKRTLLDEESKEQRVALLRDRLTTEHGLYETHRIDAYMLDDDTIFPQWARNLTAGIKDRVLYGGMGLTEDDEVTRQNLLKLPRQEREIEWMRLKAARSYELGEERLLSPAEVKAERTGKRKFFALRRKRQEREALLRSLALRQPEKWEAAPIGKLDYSHRLAVVAKHVEANVKTNGAWPLNEEGLHRAVRRQEREKAKESFLQKPGADFGVVMNRVSPALREAIKTMKTKDQPIKRISRRLYSFRLNAVRNGHQDEHGRKFQHLSRMSRQRFSKAMTAEEFELQRSLAAETSHNTRGSRKPFMKQLPRAYQQESLAFEVGRDTHMDPSRGQDNF
jgi:hypothetical protein